MANTEETGPPAGGAGTPSTEATGPASEPAGQTSPATVPDGSADSDMTRPRIMVPVEIGDENAAREFELFGQTPLPVPFDELKKIADMRDELMNLLGPRGLGLSMALQVAKKAVERGHTLEEVLEKLGQKFPAISSQPAAAPASGAVSDAAPEAVSTEFGSVPTVTSAAPAGVYETTGIVRGKLRDESERLSGLSPDDPCGFGSEGTAEGPPKGMRTDDTVVTRPPAAPPASTAKPPPIPAAALTRRERKRMRRVRLSELRARAQAAEPAEAPPQPHHPTVQMYRLPDQPDVPAPAPVPAPASADISQEVSSRTRVRELCAEHLKSAEPIVAPLAGEGDPALKPTASMPVVAPVPAAPAASEPQPAESVAPPAEPALAPALDSHPVAAAPAAPQPVIDASTVAVGLAHAATADMPVPVPPAGPGHIEEPGLPPPAAESPVGLAHEDTVAMPAHARPGDTAGIPTAPVALAMAATVAAAAPDAPSPAPAEAAPPPDERGEPTNVVKPLPPPRPHGDDIDAGLPPEPIKPAKNRRPLYVIIAVAALALAVLGADAFTRFQKASVSVELNDCADDVVSRAGKTPDGKPRISFADARQGCARTYARDYGESE